MSNSARYCWCVTYSALVFLIAYTSIVVLKNELAIKTNDKLTTRVSNEFNKLKKSCGEQNELNQGLAGVQSDR